MVIHMILSKEFTSRIDSCNDEQLLKKEMETLYHILFRNRDNTEVRLEMIEKIKYISFRLCELNSPPS
jgi:hypothetical protein